MEDSDIYTHTKTIFLGSIQTCAHQAKLGKGKRYSRKKMSSRLVVEIK